MQDNGDSAAGAPAEVRSAGPRAPTALEARRLRALRAAASRHVPLPTIIVTIALVVLVYLAGKLLYILRESILLVLVAGFLALVLNPVVAAVEKKLRRRGLAVMVVSLWAAAVFAGLAVLFGRPLVGGVTHLANGLPGYLNQVEHGKGWVGELARKYQLENWARANLTKLVTVAENLGRPAVAVGKGTLTVLFVLGTTFILVVLFLLEGPKLRRGLLAAVPPERSAGYQRLGTEISRSLSGDFLTSLIAGLVVFVTLEVLSVPYALVWAIWVALVDFLPSIGGALAGIPTVLFALTRSVTAAAITAVVFLVYQQVENRLLNPVIMSRTVKVNPLLVLVAVLIGADLGNWLGGTFAAFVAALLAVPAAGVAQVVAKEIWSATSPEPAPAQDGAVPADKLNG
jgi:predicted PurR-regulated permease PerM